MFGTSCDLGDPNSGDDPSPNPSPTPAEKEKPSFPEHADEETEKGALAFVRYYYKLIEYGHSSGDWKSLKEYSDPSCYWCDAFITKDLFDPDNDVWTRVEEVNDWGISNHTINAIATIESSKGLDGISDSADAAVDNAWQDKVWIKHNGDKWRVTKIEPRQLLPTRGCPKGRCNENSDRELPE